MALTKVTGHVVKPDTNIQFHNTKSTGIVTFTHTSNATSSTTGALQVTGGVGIVKDLHVGGNVTVGGTLTYDDVTNIDSVGIITAQSGINVSGGTLTVANDTDLNGNLDVAGISTLRGNVTIAGITTFSNVVTKFKANNGGNTHLQVLSTGSGEAGIFFDAANGDISGSDYCFIGQQDNLDFVIKANPNAGNIDFQRGANTKLRITTDSKVGIGTTNPVSKLELWNNSNIEVLRLKDTHFNKYLTIRGGGTPNRMVIDSYEGGGGGADIDLASNGSSKVRIKSGGAVGIGTLSPTDQFHVYHATDNYVARFESGDAGGGIVLKDNTHATTLLSNNGAFSIDVDNGGDLSSGESIAFKISGSEKLFINSGGDVILGGQDAVIEPGGYASHLEIHGTATDAGISIVRYSENAGGPTLIFGKSNNNTIGSISKVDEDDNLGKIEFYGVDTDWEPGASIRAFADGEWRSGSVGSEDNTDSPGRLEFHTTPNGSDNLQERMRITSGGKVGINLDDNTTADLQVCTPNTAHGLLRIGGNNTNGVGIDIDYSNSGHTKTTFKQNYRSNQETAEMSFESGFFTFISGTGSDERLRITSGGNVLIDTTVTTEASADGSDLIIGSTSDTQKGISIVGNTTNGVGNIFFTDGASYKNQGIIQYRHVDDSMRFTTNQYERVRINKTGCVGIGSTGTDQRLQVSGNIELNAHDNSGGNGGYKTSGGLIIGNAYDAGKSSLVNADRNAIIWQERGLDIDFGVSNTFIMKLHHQGKVGIGTNDPQTNLDVRGSSSSSITIGLDNGTKYGNFSCDNSATYLYGYNGNDIVFSTHTANSFNRKATLTNTGRFAIGSEDTPTTKLYVGISSSTQWSSSKNVSNTTNLDFLALDLINTDNNTSSEVGLMMEAGSSSAAQMTISTKKVSANYAELAIRTRDGGSASKEIWKLRGNGVRYVRTGATISIESGAKDASITPSNGDYIDFARVNYAGAAMGEIFIKWSSVVAPACCHHGSAHIRIGTEYLTYFYGWNDWVDVVSSSAHNSGWFSHWRLRKVTVSGTHYLYLQGKWNGSNVTGGNFQVVIGKSSYHPSGGGVIESLTPVVDNNENGDTDGSKTYGDIQAQVQGKREADSPAVSGDRITKSHSGRFHAYLGLSSHGEISAYNQPRMSAYKSASQNYDTTPTIVTYGTETFDNGNDYDPSTGKFTCPMDGVYFVSYSANISASSNWGYVECRVNGSAAFTHTRIMHYNFPRLTFAGSNYCNCAQGDEIAIYAWTNSGTLNGDNFGLFQVYMLS